jgi:predicted ATPase
MLYRNELFRIVIEGGPGSGKTSLLDGLYMQGKLGKVQVVHELATFIFGNSKAKTPEEPFLLRRFNKEFFELQLAHESMGEILARAAGKTALAMDRGLLSRLAFPGATEDDLIRATGLTQMKAVNRDDLVIFMGMPSREIYNACKENNPARLQTYDEAVASGEAALALYRGHKNLKLVPGGGTWEERLTKGAQLMNLPS